VDASLYQFIRKISLYYLTYEITRLALTLGIQGLFEVAPRLLFYPFDGVLIDRYDHLRL
jgi:hypothetical protein